MSTPKHRTAPGSSYFVTTKCWQGRSVFQVPEAAEILIKILFEYRDCSVYLLHELVIMPDHIHLLLTPSRATTLEKAMQMGDIKSELPNGRQQAVPGPPRHGPNSYPAGSCR